MDSELTVLDLFSGIGGISLGLESTGRFRTVAFCEREAFPVEVLKQRWPGIPIFPDVCTLEASDVGAVDVVAGGFPCQDVSTAGKGAGLEGARSGLWREMHRLIVALRPRWVLVENVSALRTRGADRVLADLEGAGYSAWPVVVGAVHAGAPHRRQRAFIVAHRDGAGLDRLREPARDAAGDGEGERAHGDLAHRRGAGAVDDSSRDALRYVEQREPAGRARGLQDEGAPVARGRGADLDDAPGAGREAGDGAAGLAGSGSPLVGGLPNRWPAGPGQEQFDWEARRLAYTTLSSPARQRMDRGDLDQSADGSAEGYGGEQVEGRFVFPLGQPADGIPSQLVRRHNRDSLKALGNSVVPQVIAAIGRAILTVEDER